MMVWAGITLDGRTHLEAFERGTVTAVTNRDEMLEPYVHLIRGAIGPNLILMDDKTRPHRAQMVDEFLEREDVRWMDCPVRSPDLFFIERAWNTLRRAIATCKPPSRTIQGLKTEL
ncbi:transposable element Tc1 transposase [Trichonephila clavipes]|uniref:Transposable element Tc1 transposase n=1 Tax=Trichonephila clavipes TaxID=2585209 RepID=A0A8X6S316_TRICX|nr:transposable element Tc1 transposase [Trichonephila clavipes]